MGKRGKPTKQGVQAQKKQRKEDALALARLIYEIYKEQQLRDRVDTGQNDASRIKDEFY